MPVNLIARMSPSGPGCVKTQTPGPIAQQLNREGRVDESLLRQSAVSRFKISSRSPENRFYTAWVNKRHPQPCPECRLLRAKRKSISGGWMSVHSHKATFRPRPKGLFQVQINCRRRLPRRGELKGVRFRTLSINHVLTILYVHMRMNAPSCEPLVFREPRGKLEWALTGHKQQR